VLPPVVWQCTGISWLNVRDNQLVALAPEVSRLAMLTHLDLGNNQLQELDPVIGKLERLAYEEEMLLSFYFNVFQRYLDVSENQIVALPNELCLLVNLVTLKASSNKLEALDSLKVFVCFLFFFFFCLSHTDSKGFSQSAKAGRSHFGSQPSQGCASFHRIFGVSAQH
jgi:hypothetical protein